MGLTLHYSARLRKLQRLSELTAEVEDICQSLDWKCHRLDATLEVPAAAAPLEPGDGESKPIRLQGVYFNPPKCETAFLTFTPSGRTSTPMNLEIAEDLAGVTADLVYSVHVKTQYAGLQTHVALVTLLKYLEKKYCYKMKVYDEGNFWKTLDQAVLQARFDEYWSLITAVKGALEKENWSVTDEPLKLASKMEELIRRRMGD